MCPARRCVAVTSEALGMESWILQALSFSFLSERTTMPKVTGRYNAESNTKNSLVVTVRCTSLGIINFSALTPLCRARHNGVSLHPQHPVLRREDHLDRFLLPLVETSPVELRLRDSATHDRLPGALAGPHERNRLRLPRHGCVRGPVFSRFEALRGMEAALPFEAGDGPLRRLGCHRARLPGQRRRQKIPMAEHRLALGKVLHRPGCGLRRWLSPVREQIRQGAFPLGSPSRARLRPKTRAPPPGDPTTVEAPPCPRPASAPASSTPHGPRASDSATAPLHPAPPSPPRSPPAASKTPPLRPAPPPRSRTGRPHASSRSRTPDP